MKRTASLATLLLLAAIACSPTLELPPRAKVSCTESGQCPDGLLCHAGLCVEASSIDTVAPDLAETPIVAPAIGMAGTAFTVTVTSTKALAQPPTLILGLDVPEEVACAPASGRTFDCPYTATGAENGGAGGSVSFDVRLVDLANNQATKRLAGILRLDFRAPDVLPGSASLVLVPPEGNPLRAVGAAGTGSILHVAFTVDEALATDPLVVGSGPESELSFSKLSEAGESFLYEYALEDADPKQGSYAVDVQLTDLAGNQVTRTLALPGSGLVVDTIAPTAPATGTAGLITYRRVPWGSRATGGAARFEVSSAPGAVEPGALVQVFDGPDPSSSAELGRGTAGAEGGFEAISIGRADHTVVFVAAVDAAGNRSPTAEVRDVEWTVTLGGKVPGSTMENPTRLVSTPWLEPVVAQTPEVSFEPDQPSLDAAKALDGASLSRAGEGRWVERGMTSAAPLRRYKHTMAYDSDRGKMLVFGGHAADTNRDHSDLWEWDGATGVWTDRTPIGIELSPSQAAVLVYDQWRARMLLFIGEDYLTGGTSTWEWNPQTGFWLDRTPVGTPSPPGRNYFAMAYDSARGKAVLFGGASIDSPDSLNDTWEWDGEKGTWTQRFPVVSPAARDGLAMGYDSTRGKVMLWGGWQTDAATWEWDGDAGTWTMATAVGPAGDRAARMAYDSARRRMILWGGSRGATLWEYDADLQLWTDRSPTAGAAPCGAEEAGVAFDVARERTVIFGGVGNCGTNSYTNQVWDWDGGQGTWTNRTRSETASSVPLGRRYHSAAYDPVRRKVVVYGGATDNGIAQGTATQLTDTWEFDPDGGTWKQIGAASNPGALSNPAMAFDAFRNTVILFGGYKSGGYSAETWEWNGTNWTRLSPATSPPGRSDHAMVGCVRGGSPRILMFGGSRADGPWEWNGATGTWADLAPSSGAVPAQRMHPGLAWDPDRGRVVMFGGWLSATTTDLWEWDGSGWTPRPVAAMPPPRRGHFGFAYERARKKFVVWGGADGSNRAMTDLWGWDPASGLWTDQTPTSGTFPVRDGLAAWYDPVREAPSMFGGAETFWKPLSRETWEWQSGVESRPAFLWSVPWSAAGERNATILGLAVNAQADGRGNDDSDAAVQSTGAAILAWNYLAGAWSQLASNAAGDGPEPLTFATADHAALRGLLPGSAPTTLAVAPLAFLKKGTERPRVSLDYLELVVTYRRNP